MAVVFIQFFYCFFYEGSNELRVFLPTAHSNVFFFYYIREYISISEENE